MYVQVTGDLYFLVMSMGDLETDVVSLERIAEMSHIEQEVRKGGEERERESVCA